MHTLTANTSSNPSKPNHSSTSLISKSRNTGITSSGTMSSTMVGKPVTEVVEAEKQTLDCVMHWQLTKFLPAPLQPIFHDWVVEFVEIMHKLKKPRLTKRLDSTPRPTQLPVRALGDEKDDKDKILLGKEFEKPLKRQIAGLIRRQKDEMLHPELASDYTFPVLPGSHLKLQPRLQLVKSLMQVLSLDKNITMEARLLRKELLVFSKSGNSRMKHASRILRKASRSLKLSARIARCLAILISAATTT